MVKKPGGNKRRQQNRNYIRKNDKIRAREVRVIGPDGNMLGLMAPEDALKIAKFKGPFPPRTLQYPRKDRI